MISVSNPANAVVTAGSSHNLGPDEVHVFAARLESSLVGELRPTLSPDERERADRFVFSPDRERFVVARGLLRRFLADYTSAQPHELRFILGEKGKPALAGMAQNSISFNLAHSHEFAVYAFCRSGKVGVDVEFSGRELDYHRVAQRFFSSDEFAAMQKLSGELQKEAFFDCWTRKEAYIKARGEGLSIPLDDFNVSLEPDRPAALLNYYKDPQECSRWSMRSFTIDPEYKAALVHERQCSSVHFFKAV